jgi:hypothetical protein
MSNHLINVVQALDAKKLKAAIKARGLVGVNVKPLLWIVADKSNDERLGKGSFWSQEKMAKMIGCGKRNVKSMQDVAKAIGLLNVTHRKVEGGRDKTNILVLTREVLAYIDEELLEDVGATVSGITEWVRQLPAVDEPVAGSGCKDCGEVGARVAVETKYSKPNGIQEGEAKASAYLPNSGDEIADLPVTDHRPTLSAGTKPRPAQSRTAGTVSPSCSHYYQSGKCPHCLAKKDCKPCGGRGLKVVKAPTKRDPMHEAQVVCECTGLVENKVAP